TPHPSTTSSSFHCARSRMPSRIPFALSGGGSATATGWPTTSFPVNLAARSLVVFSSTVVIPARVVLSVEDISWQRNGGLTRCGEDLGEEVVAFLDLSVGERRVFGFLHLFRDAE